MSKDMVIRKKLKEVYHRQWNSMTNYEPVGCHVLLLTSTGEVVIGHRKTFASNKGIGTYYRTDGSEIKNNNLDYLLGWSYQ